jgi:hypothetical protein
LFLVEFYMLTCFVFLTGRESGPDIAEDRFLGTSFSIIKGDRCRQNHWVVIR